MIEMRNENCQPKRELVTDKQIADGPTKSKNSEAFLTYGTMRTKFLSNFPISF
jgi:hypothetical protein